MLPAELMKDFIGKVCSIIVFDSSIGIGGKIEAVEENWIKVNQKGKCRLINGDMVKQIEIMPEKYQK